MFYDQAKNETMIDESDQCYNCRYFEEGDDDATRCPLFNALTQGLVYLTEPVNIEGCKIHVPIIHA